MYISYIYHIYTHNIIDIYGWIYLEINNWITRQTMLLNNKTAFHLSNKTDTLEYFYTANPS